MDDTDQDIDIAGTEADEDFWKQHGNRVPRPHDPTATPLGAVADDPVASVGTPPGRRDPKV